MQLSLNLQSNFNRKASIVNLKLALLLLCLIVTGCQQQHELNWVQEKDYRWAELPDFNSNKVGFSTLYSSDTNIDFTNKLTEDEIVENRHLLNGSGVAAGDINGDGLVDLYFAGLNGPNKLFKNAGNLQFEDITESAGVAHSGYYSTGVTFADIDGDNDLDLLVATNSSGVFLYKNDGSGNFKLTQDSGLHSSEGKGATTLTLSDIDNDGDLDLYVTHYKQKSVRDIYNPADLQWNRVVQQKEDDYFIKPPYDEHYTLIQQGNNIGRYEYGEKDALYINTGNGDFEKVTQSDSVFYDTEGNPTELNKGWGLTAKFYDLNDDGFQDLYVNNDFWTKDQVWINQSDGTFKKIDDLAIRSLSASSMGVDFADIDKDGHTDFFTTDMLSRIHTRRMRQIATEEPIPPTIGEINNRPLYMRNMLFRNRGDNTFEEIAQYAGVDASEWSWATHFMDIDLDGYEDLFITTGNAYDVQDADVAEKIASGTYQNREEAKRTVLSYPSLELKNRVFKNNGDLTFTDKNKEWGFTEEDISHGAATADLDNDGDLEIIVNRLNEEALIYKNGISKPRIAVRLIGKKPNTQAIGARVILKNNNETQRKEITSGGNYLSGSDPLAVFAADLDQTYELTVHWNDGEKSTFKDIAPNRIYEIPKPDSSSSSQIKKSNSSQNLFFEDRTAQLNFQHHEERYQDFRLQPLLPYKLSRLGPGVAWIDHNSNGYEDLLIGSGKGGRLGVLQNSDTNNPQWKKQEVEPLTKAAPGDQTGIVGWKESGEVHLLVGSANYEQGRTEAPSANHYILENGTVTGEKQLPGTLSTTGPLALADYDGDGDLDLFLGGNFLPAQYPVSADSRLFKNEGGSFALDEENSKKLQEVGLVKSATFSDINSDGRPDLLLATEWGPIRVFINNDGNYTEATQKWGLHRHTGLWNGIATGDLNNDGRPDIVATNRGLNSHYQVKGNNPLYIFYGDVDKDRRLEIFEAYESNETSTIVPLRNMEDVSDSDKTLERKVSSHAEYGNASLKQIIGAELNRVPHKTANTLTNMTFINMGKQFKPQPLPDKAQFTTSYYAGIADYDGDGNEDIFLSQNLFALPTETSRSDAGRGLWLKGDGNANFDPRPGQETGIKIYGEQRGAALGDYNKDGRIDLAVSQNGSDIKLFENIKGKQALRVSLQGPASNEWAIGSSARLVFENGQKGPLKEIQAGTGYWSQNSRVLLFGFTDKPTAIEVNWFDGTSETVDIGELPDSLYLTINYPKN